MNIGNESDRSGLPAKTIRYNEDISLIRPHRGVNGYRTFDNADVHRLAFLTPGRSLGFSIDSCRDLLAMYRDAGRASADVKQVADEHQAQIKRKIAEFEGMRGTLADLVPRRHGDEHPNCPILDDLSIDESGEPAEGRPIPEHAR